MPVLSRGRLSGKTSAKCADEGARRVQVFLKRRQNSRHCVRRPQGICHMTQLADAQGVAFVGDARSGKTTLACLFHLTATEMANESDGSFQYIPTPSAFKFIKENVSALQAGIFPKATEIEDFNLVKMDLVWKKWNGWDTASLGFWDLSGAAVTDALKALDTDPPNFELIWASQTHMQKMFDAEVIMFVADSFSLANPSQGAGNVALNLAQYLNGIRVWKKQSGQRLKRIYICCSKFDLVRSTVKGAGDFNLSKSFNDWNDDLLDWLRKVAPEFANEISNTTSGRTKICDDFVIFPTWINVVRDDRNQPVGPIPSPKQPIDYSSRELREFVDSLSKIKE